VKSIVDDLDCAREDPGIDRGWLLLQVKQFKLKIAEHLAALAVPLDALLAKTLFQNADLQLRVLELAALRYQLLLLLFNLPGSLIYCT